MALDQRKYERKHTDVLRDLRPAYVRLGDWLKKPANSGALYFLTAFLLYQNDMLARYADVVLIIFLFYFLWLAVQDRSLAFKMPYGAKWKDKRNEGPGRSGKGEGILYLGNVKDTNEEIWFTNSDARTHILYLGTTGAGKTEGLKSMVTNALSWGSGFIYVDGKADTDLWSSLSSLCRRFGRDDDLLVLNYMTGNSDVRAPSNTMNPFSSGSASYLTNMLVSLMPDAEGDNAMWKERAVALVASLMPALTWKRDNQDIPMSVSTIREYLNLDKVIKLSRDETLPPDISIGIKGYLETLPGYIDKAFDDNGQEKPPGPDQPQYDTTTPRQQHGYLSMQFTRALQSLGDEYGYIFDTQAADVDMVDCVLNRRILIVLIPALEKSADETANLGKIVAATLKGMMGSTLGSKVEGESATVIENKPTHSATPFMTVFDEVGYYTAQGMAVMAAQARSLGFCLIYSAQDLPAMEKRVKEEARSITANCNIKIFGKLEDPTQTKEFFEKTVGSALVIEASGFQLHGGRSTGSYVDSQQAGLQIRPRASYEGLKGFKEGEACIAFGEMVVDTSIFYSNPGMAKAMRVTRYVSLPPPDENVIRHSSVISQVRDLMVHKTWTAMKADVKADTPEEIKVLADTVEMAKAAGISQVEGGMASVAAIHAIDNPAVLDETSSSGDKAPAQKAPPTVGDTPATMPQKKDPPVSSSPKPPPIASQVTSKESSSSAEPVSPVSRPVQPPSEQKAPPSSGDEKASSGNASPMAFFAKKDDKAADSSSDDNADGKGEAASSPASVPEKPPSAAEPQSPISWEDLIKETEKSGKIPDAPTGDGEQKASSAVPDAKKEPLLDEKTEKVLSRAGEETRKALFKNGDDSADTAE